MKSSISRFVIFTLMQFWLLTTLISQDKYLSILDKCIGSRNQFESISYTMLLQNKSFTMEDTAEHQANVLMVRDLKDSLYNGFFSIEMDTLWFAYDGEQVVKAMPGSSILITGDPRAYPGLFVKSTWVDNFLDYGFLKQSPGPKVYLQDSTIQSSISDTVIGGWPCIGILFKLPDQDAFQRQIFFVAIDTIEFKVRNRMYSVFFQENEQYTNWHYKDIQYGHDTSISKLAGDFASAFQHFEQYNSDTTYIAKPQEFDYAQLSGKLFNTDEEFRMAQVHANLIILDFWYTSCYPCIKGIPAINRIAREYKDKGVEVLGINMIDDEEKSKARLEKFFKNNQMEYKPIMVNPEFAGQIGIRAYPTLIILDKEYNVIYMEDGFSEDLYEKIAGVLNANL